MTTARIDWTDVEDAARQLAGNWRRIDSFAWLRGCDLADADRWMIWYTSHRDAGLLARSNERAIEERLRPFAEGDDPDVVFERHSHWAAGHLDGFSVRVYGADGAVTPAFEEFCRIKEELAGYPLLDERDYAWRVYEATLANYRNELGRLADGLSDRWEAQVYSWFNDHGEDRFTDNRDDEGGWAPREAILRALRGLGLVARTASQSDTKGELGRSVT
jgi:hypothetical protein